jgi:hypothetical protein
MANMPNRPAKTVMEIKDVLFFPTIRLLIRTMNTIRTSTGKIKDVTGR